MMFPPVVDRRDFITSDERPPVPSPPPFVRDDSGSPLHTARTYPATRRKRSCLSENEYRQPDRCRRRRERGLCVSPHNADLRRRCCTGNRPNEKKETPQILPMPIRKRPRCRSRTRVRETRARRISEHRRGSHRNERRSGNAHTRRGLPSAAENTHCPRYAFRLHLVSFADSLDPFASTPAEGARRPPSNGPVPAIRDTQGAWFGDAHSGYGAPVASFFADRSLAEASQSNPMCGLCDFPGSRFRRTHGRPRPGPGLVVSVRYSVGAEGG